MCEKALDRKKHKQVLICDALTAEKQFQRVEGLAREGSFFSRRSQKLYVLTQLNILSKGVLQVKRFITALLF